MAASRRPPTNMTWIINPEMRGMMYSQDGRETWVVHYQVPPGADWRDVDAKAVVAAMIGADVRSRSSPADRGPAGSRWSPSTIGPAVFLAGDAAHLFTPLGGLGMNTGIGDVMNLAGSSPPCTRAGPDRGCSTATRSSAGPMGVRNCNSASAARG